MSRIKQIFYSFSFYDTVDKKRKKANFNTYKGAISYRNELLLDTRYTNISDIFQDFLDI